MHRPLLFVSLLILSGSGLCGDQFDCRITGVGTFSSGWYLQCEGGSRVAAPACATQPNQHAMLWTAPASKETYSLALALWLSNKNARVNGTGSCTVMSNRETLSALERQGM